MLLFAQNHQHPTLWDRTARKLWCGESFYHAPLSLNPVLGPEETIVTTGGEHVTLLDPVTFAPKARLGAPGAPWRALAASSRHLVGVGASLTLEVLDWFSRTRCQVPMDELRGVQELYASSGWIVMRARSSQGWGVSVWKIDPKTHGPRLHMAHLSRQHVIGPTRSLDPYDTWCSCCIDERTGHLFIYTSASAGSSTPVGWRGVVECVDLERAQVVWHVAIEAEWTGDVRPMSSLMFVGGGRGVCTHPRLRPGSHELWVGGEEGRCMILDCRDGALMEMKFYGGTQTLVDHAWSQEGEYVGLGEKLTLVFERS